MFRFTDADGDLNLWSDSDWANCPSSRKSHSGGVLRVGVHPIKHWCKIQGKIAGSSGEAEILSANTGLSELAQVKHVFDELFGPRWCQLDHFVDASVCHSLLVRTGAGGFKHFETKDLWGQQLVRKMGVVVHRIPRAINFSDLMTSPSSATSFDNFLRELDVIFIQEDSPEITAKEHVANFPTPRVMRGPTGEVNS